MSNQYGQAFDDLRNTLSECARIVRQRWKLCATALSLVGSAAFWLSQYLPREYAASTLFERRDDVVLQNLIHSNSPYSFEALKSTIALDMVGQRALLRAMIAAKLAPADALRSDAALDEQERATLDALVAQFQLRADLKLLHSSASLDQVMLRCSGNDPRVVREVVVALRDNYINDSRARMREILSGARAFFANEVARLEKELVHSEASLRDGFEDVPGFDPTDVIGVGNRLEILRNQRDALLQQTTALEAEIGARQDFLAQLPAAIAADLASLPENDRERQAATDVRGVDAALDAALDSLQRQIVDRITTKRMTTEHPEIKSLQARLAALESLRESVVAAKPPEPEVSLPLAQRSSPRPPPEWKAQQMRVELEIDALRKQLVLARSQLEQADDRLTRFERLHSRLVAKDEDIRGLLERRQNATRELGIWQGHLANLERIMAAESGERGTQFTLIEEPEKIAFPIRPAVASVFAGCSGFSLAIAALVVALAELFDRSFRTAGQVSRSIGLPLLATVGVLPTPRERRRAVLRRAVWTPALIVFATVLSGSVWVAYASLRMPAEHARALAQIGQAADAAGVPNLLPLPARAESE